MAQHLLQGPHVHAVLQHQGGGGVAQLVAGVEGRVQTRLQKPLFYHIMDSRRGHAGVGAGEEEGVFVRRRLVVPLLQPVVQRLPAGLVEENHPFFVAFAQHTELFLPDIGQVKTN